MPAHPALGTLGRYELLEEIGRGMTAVVYRALDPLLARTVAVKVVDLPSHLSAADRLVFEERVLAQARLAGRLSHPGIVIAHDAGKDPETGRVFIVFEQVEGQTLAARLEAGPPFDPRQALQLVQRLAEALHHAHAGGVIHRDVRPANILVLPSGDPKLMDLGAARIETARMTLTSMREAFGAPLYMSPEQAVGESIDALTDVFSLGAVAYRLLTGRDAFAADDPRGILARVVHHNPPPPSHLVPDLPAGVDEMIAHALAKSRKDRYPDAGSFAEDVSDALAGRWPRHSEGRKPPSGTERFQAALSVSSGAAASAHLAGEQTIPVAADWRLRWGFRSPVRLLAGAVALTLVAGIELVRRGGEAPAAPLPASPPGSSPRRPPDPKLPALVADPDLPSINQASPAPVMARLARLHVELSHTLKSGRLLVFVDGKKALDQRVAATSGRSVLGLRMRAGRVGRTLELAPGRRHIRVQVLWSDGQRSEAIVGNLKATGTRRLSARLSRISKNLSLEWQ